LLLLLNDLLVIAQLGLILLLIDPLNVGGFLGLLDLLGDNLGNHLILSTEGSRDNGDLVREVGALGIPILGSNVVLSPAIGSILILDGSIACWSKLGGVDFKGKLVPKAGVLVVVVATGQGACGEDADALANGSHVSQFHGSIALLAPDGDAVPDRLLIGVALASTEGRVIDGNADLTIHDATGAIRADGCWATPKVIAHITDNGDVRKTCHGGVTFLSKVLRLLGFRFFKTRYVTLLAGDSESSPPFSVTSTSLMVSHTKHETGTTLGTARFPLLGSS
jgi:hypothetical protein